MGVSNSYSQQTEGSGHASVQDPSPHWLRLRADSICQSALWPCPSSQWVQQSLEEICLLAEKIWLRRTNLSEISDISLDFIYIKQIEAFQNY